VSVIWAGESEADRLSYFEDFGNVASVGGQNVAGMYSDGYTESGDASGVKPVFTTTEQAAAAVGLAFKSTIVITGVGTYLVNKPARPDGTGMITFELTKTA
jgi:hypothetical protein